MPTLVRLSRESSVERVPAPDAESAAFAEAVLWHGLGPLALAATGDGRLEWTDRGPIARIQGQVAREAVTVALLRAQEAGIHAALSRAGVESPILIKGPAVANRFYADPALRPFVDLDYLIAPGAVDAAAAALQASGWERLVTEWPADQRRHGHTIDLERSVGVNVLRVELHWRVSDDPLADRLDHAVIVNGARPLDGTVSLVPHPRDQLLLLAVHLLHHPEQRLIWLLDLERVTRALTETEWRAAFAVARELGLDWVLHRAIDIVEAVLGTARPRPEAPVAAAGWGPLRLAHAVGGPLGFHVGHLATLSWRDRARYLAVGVRRRAAAARPGDRRR